MLQLTFKALQEREPGAKWQKLFNDYWPAYKAWFVSKGAAEHPSLSVCVEALEKYMPEMMPTYKKLCALAGHDQLAARFLTGFQPPAYISGCSQLVWASTPMLIRNYDYHPHLSEGTILHSAWNGKKVMATGDCLCGAVDGINEDGLVVSLTFGGRKHTGVGFGIPFIIRYVLEFCSTIDEAVNALKRVPSHMAYNVMVMNKAGEHKLVQLTPGLSPVVLSDSLSVNHQGAIDWPEHAAFSKTIKREKFLNDVLSNPDIKANEVIDSFLQAPLFNRQYNDGFGTLYTAVYKPAAGQMEVHWPDKKIINSFGHFTEEEFTISYQETAPGIPAYATTGYSEPALPETKAVDAYQHHDAEYWIAYGKAWASGTPTALARQVAHSIVDAIGLGGDEHVKIILEKFINEHKRRGQIPWEMLADVWEKIGRN